MCSCWGIPYSPTAGPPTHNWLGSHSISASRPSLMLLSPALPLSHPPSIILPLSVFVCLFPFYLLACLSPRFFLDLSLHSLRTAYRPHCQATLAKINNIILIQTDIKRQRASKLFLCRLIISPCFSKPFGPFDLLFRRLLWASLAQHVWTELRCYIRQSWQSCREYPWAPIYEISLFVISIPDIGMQKHFCNNTGSSLNFS